MQSEEQRKSFSILSAVVSAPLGILVTVIGAIIIGKLQSKEPHLSYSVVSSIPFSGTSNVVSIYQMSVVNDGKREVEDVMCVMRIAGGKIEQYKTSIAPSIGVTENVLSDTLKVQVASLNPADTVTISILASAPRTLPSRPEVSIHAKGVNGEEKTETSKVSELSSHDLVWLSAGAGGFAVLSSAVLFPLVRRVVGGSSQAEALEMICRAAEFDDEATRYSNLKSKVWYRDEADRLTAEALQSGTDAAVAKAHRILSVLVAYSRVSAGSRAVVLFNLARLEAFKGNEPEATNYLNAARIVSKSVVEERLRMQPLPKRTAIQSG